MKKITLLSLAILFLSFSACAKKPKNVIFIIGDGMGIAQIHTGLVVNSNQLELERMSHVGFSKTYSASNFTTDSGAGGTALSSGVKTNNYMIGMGPDTVAVESIMELAKKNKRSTGLVVSCNVTHATPASYVAHQKSRYMAEEIAADYINSDIDVFIGGGRKNFEIRKDHRNLSNELKEKSYNIAYTLDQAKKIKEGKLAGLLYDNHPPAMPKRGDMLPDGLEVALDILDNNRKGFFLLIEGSQIDWAGHDNNANQIAKEMLDLDKTIGRALDFAKKDKNTLVIVTADHETGGLTILDGDYSKGTMKTSFSTKGHSGVVVPVFSYGPGAENFTGFMENTSFKNKIKKLMRLKDK